MTNLEWMQLVREPSMTDFELNLMYLGEGCFDIGVGERLQILKIELGQYVLVYSTQDSPPFGGPLQSQMGSKLLWDRGLPLGLRLP